jgi:hypothetical protein
MSRVVSVSTGKPYTLSRVCRVWERARSTTYRRLGQPEQQLKQRPGPKGPCSDSELVRHIREVITESSFHGEGYRKVWARLRMKHVHSSRRRVLRLMRENHLQATQRPSSHPGPKNHDGTIIPDNVHEMWGTDMTQASPARTDGSVCSERWTTFPPLAWECTGPSPALASRPWNLSNKESEKI